MKIHKPNKRADIESLRAIAVVLVVLFHAGIDAFSGGFIGVDIFFVISGFLIINIVKTEVDNNTFSYASFLNRRAKRILPPLVLVCIFVLLAYYLIGFGFEVESVAESVASIFVFSSNLYFWRTQDYFSPEAGSNPLIHTWSLSVEEQFYFIFPMLLMLLFRLSKEKVFWLYIALLIAAITVMIVGSLSRPVAAFYLVPTRGWEFLIGGLLAVTRNIDFKLAHYPVIQFFNQYAGYLGMSLIIFSLFWAPSIEDKSLLYTLPVCFGTLLIIASHNPNAPDSLLDKLLKNGVLVFIGGISYSFYLWHQPLIALTKSLLPYSDIEHILLLVGILSFLPAYFSTKYLERPILNLKHIKVKTVLTSGAFACVVMLSIGILVSQFDQGLLQNISPEVDKILAKAKDNNPRLHGCRAEFGREIRLERSCVYGAEVEPTVAIWGDSHVNQLTFSLGQQLKKDGIGLIELSYAGCPPILDVYRTDKEYLPCAQRNKQVLDFIKSQHNLKSVILHSHWIGYMDLGMINALGSRGSLSTSDYLKESFSKTIGELEDAGVEVIILGPVPTLHEDPVLNTAKRSRLKGLFNVIERSKKFSYDKYKKTSNVSRDIISFVSNKHDIEVLTPANYFCNRELNHCKAFDNNIYLYRDANHLSKSGADILLETMYPDLRDMLFSVYRSHTAEVNTEN